MAALNRKDEIHHHLSRCLMRSALTTAAPTLRSSQCGCRPDLFAPHALSSLCVPLDCRCCYRIPLLLSCIAFRLMAAFVLDFDGCRASVPSMTRPGPHWSSCRQALWQQAQGCCTLLAHP